METVLVTGGCGYIGSHTCVSLLENNHNVLIIDSLINSYKDSFEKIKKTVELKGIDVKNNIQFFQGDLRDKVWLDNIFSDYLRADKPIKSVIHFAGLKSIYNSIKSPLEYWDSNITSTITLLSTMQKYDCYTLIFSSSASIYKPKGFKLLKENDELKPSTPYGKTKLCIEQILCDLFACEKKWKIVSLRYFNPIGSHSLGFLPENSKGKSSNLFPAIQKTITGRQNELLIYGYDWPTCDGTCIRDFIHVMDLAEAHIASLNYLKENKSQNIAINIGTGKGSTILEIIKKFQEIKGISFTYNFTNRRLGDEPFLVAENTLALKLLDWFPKRNIEDMCNDYVIDL